MDFRPADHARSIHQLGNTGIRRAERLAALEGTAMEQYGRAVFAASTRTGRLARYAVRLCPRVDGAAVPAVLAERGLAGHNGGTQLACSWTAPSLSLAIG